MSDIFSAIAALAALGTLFVAYMTLREGRSTISELRTVAGELGTISAEAAKETAAQERLVGVSQTTAVVLHAVFVEAQAARRVEALVRVRSALADVAYATHQVVNENVTPMVFYGARQRLRAALVGVPSAERLLPIGSRISTADSVAYARSTELDADDEVARLLDGARELLESAGRTADSAMETLTRS